MTEDRQRVMTRRSRRTAGGDSAHAQTRRAGWRERREPFAEPGSAGWERKAVSTCC